MYHPTQPRATPTRIFEANISHNPFKWFGIWTPRGWRVNLKRWGKAERYTVRLSGDGRRTFFPNALLHPETRQVAWQDDLHLQDDPLTDGGIYPAEPRVEYPPGQQRWAISHTLLCYPTADHNLHTHEYTWDMTHGHLKTHFRRRVLLEEARTDARDGKTVEILNKPISLTIEANTHYPLPNSAVRGVWLNPQKSGRNLYTRRVVQLVPMLNAVYGMTPFAPIVQCHGVWPVSDHDPVDELFDPTTKLCRDPKRIIGELNIPLDEPKIAMMMPKWRQVESKIYEGPIALLAEPEAIVDQAYLNNLRQRMGSRFEPNKVGYAATQAVNQDDIGYAGYDPCYDLNDDGLIDQADEQRLQANLGRRVRYNIYRSAYFGADWISAGSAALAAEHAPGVPVIADYTYGGGYDAQAGVIQLLETPGPNQSVWVEYFHDAPAEAGENNILVHCYREC